MPEKQDVALAALLKRADIRSNIIERTGTGSRPPLAAAIVRAITKTSWITDAEDNFRAFMKILNRFGGGELFEAMNASEIDNLIAA